MHELRELELDDDLDAYNDGSASWPGALFLRERSASTPKEIPRSLVGAEVDGRPAGFLLAVGLPIRSGGRCFGSLYVQRWARRRGLGAALRERLLADLSSFGLPGVVLAADESPTTLHVAEHWGYPIIGRHYESELDLTSLDEEREQAAVARVGAAGVELLLLRDDEQVTDDDLRTVYPFFTERFREAPDADGASGDMPFPVFAGFIADPWRLLLARRKGELVGLTGVCPRDAATVNTFFTGVHAEHRGLGIGLALKARHAALLRDRGYRRLITQNMDSNAPILAANDRLGFRRMHAYVDVQVDLPVSR